MSPKPHRVTDGLFQRRGSETEQKKNQKEINHAEWNNPDNWSVGFYFREDLI